MPKMNKLIMTKIKDHQKNPIFSKEYSEWQMMSLINSIKNSCFSAILDPSDTHENHPYKKTCIKRAFWLQSQAHVSMHK